MKQKLFRRKFFRKGQETKICGRFRNWTKRTNDQFQVLECQPILIDRAWGTFDSPVDRKKIKKMREVIKILKQLGRECIAELIGTLILCGFGNASIAVFILAPQNLSSSLSVHFSWGLGKQLFKSFVRYWHVHMDLRTVFVLKKIPWIQLNPDIKPKCISGACFGCYVSKSISGGHINPAVTVMKTVFGQFPIYKMIPFIISQTIGAFLSSCLVYLGMDFRLRICIIIIWKTIKILEKRISIWN